VIRAIDAVPEKEFCTTADNDDNGGLVDQAIAFAIIGFILYSCVDVIRSFAGAITGEISPLEPIAFLVILLGFCAANLVIVGLGCLVYFIGACHTRSIRGH
jgi:hypothetical protein